ncbi:prolipoprotein diacylglyceryl transferase family protein, partial [Chloroflexota bacterium]
MIKIGIDPILVTLGPFTLSWHSLFILVAMAAAVWLSARLVTKAGLTTDTFHSLVLWCIPGGIIGARLIHIIDYWS